MRVFLVPVLVAVEAPSKAVAAAEVHGLMEYAFEVSNDEGRFKSHVVTDDKSLITLQPK